MKYVLIYTPNETLKIYGPFVNGDAATEWAEAWNEKNQVQFWQVIDTPIVEFYPVH